VSGARLPSLQPARDYTAAIRSRARFGLQPRTTERPARAGGQRMNRPQLALSVSTNDGRTPQVLPYGRFGVLVFAPPLVGDDKNENRKQQ